MTAHPEAWKLDAACIGVDPDLFFPGPGTTGVMQARKAITICGGCDVKDECLRWAIDTGETDGIYGGLTAKQRRNLTVRPRLRLVVA